MIGSPGASPRVRATFNTSPTRRYAYTNSNTNENNIGQIRTRVIDPNNLRRMRRMRMSFANTSPVRRRLNFGNNNNKPKSPPKAPKKINVSKYEKMLKNLENKEKKNTPKNNKPNAENKNVANWFNNGGLAAKKSNIPKDMRAFLLVDVTKDGKIRHVYDKRYLWGIIRAWEKGFNENMGSRRKAKSPFTKNPFGKGDIRSYPPDKRTKVLMKESILRASLENKVRTMKYIPPDGKNNKMWNKSVQKSIDLMISLIQSGRVKTMEQLELLMLVHQIVGPGAFTGRNTKIDYYKAVLDGKFKPHHIEMMKKAPKTSTLFFDSTIVLSSKPLYKLSPEDTKMFIALDPYMKKTKENLYRNNFPGKEGAVLLKLQMIIDGPNNKHYKNTQQNLRESIARHINKTRNKKLYNLLMA
jgi:hypothetical protein